MRAHLLERASQRLDIGVRQALREVSLDSVAVVAASLLHGFDALVGEGDEDRAASVLGANATNESFHLHAVDDMSEAGRACRISDRNQKSTGMGVGGWPSMRL